MRVLRGSLVLIVCGLALGVEAQTPDPLLRAMHDEIERSRKLTVPNLEAPYFIEYLMEQSENFSVAASLGGLVSLRHDRFRIPEAIVRVGDYKFDNTNFAGGGGGGTRYDLGPWPLDDSYPVLRRYLWLATDSAYKAAVETISRKRAALQNLAQSSTLDDFGHAAPVQRVRDFQHLTIDEQSWTARVRALSAVFADYPKIEDSRVDLESSAGGYYVVNSEGTEVREPENVTYLRVRAMTQAPDGTTLRDAVTFNTLDAGRMPGDAELNREVRKMADNLVALAQAAKGEDYSGPVLFEGDASPQLFAQLLGRNLALPRKPEGSRGGFNGSELEGRLGSRILPESFDVVDDPTQKEWRGRPLFGSYDVDIEGVAAKPVGVVEKGVLKGYLLTRQPVRGFSESNGHARLPGAYGTYAATIGNLFIASSETTPAGQLKQKLIEMIQARSLPYGVVVRRLDFPSSASVDEARRQLMSAQGSAHPVSQPLLVYKVFADGHEEMVRGWRFRGLSARSLKDIAVTGDDSAVFEYQENGAPFALLGVSSFSAEVCVVAPSILIDDLELHPAEDEPPKLPVAPAPEIAR